MRKLALMRKLAHVATMNIMVEFITQEDPSRSMIERLQRHMAEVEDLVLCTMPAKKLGALQCLIENRCGIPGGHRCLHFLMKHISLSLTITYLMATKPHPDTMVIMIMRDEKFPPCLETLRITSRKSACCLRCLRTAIACQIVNATYVRRWLRFSQQLKKTFLQGIQKERKNLSLVK